jgi:F420-0:gamma-glutamyl ligase
MAFPGQTNLDAYLTDTYTLSVHYKDSAGSGVDLDTSTIEMDIRDSEKDPVSQVIWSTVTGEIAPTAGGALSAGQFTVTVAASQIERLGTRGDVKRYFYELRRKQGAVVDTLISGAFRVYGEPRN